MSNTSKASSLEFAKLLGTDIFGRSVLYKILIGTRTAITIGFFVTGMLTVLVVIFALMTGRTGSTEWHLFVQTLSRLK